MKQFTFCALLCLLVACGPTDKGPITLTVLHTNDTHSQVEPLVKNDRGGYARRMGMIEQERLADPDLLLLDAGDFWQGTPYFNFFHGRVEIEAMNYMRYDAATLGNHEFDNGVDTLAAVLKLAEFPVVCANYGVEGTVLEGVVKNYVIIKRKGLKIGITGVGCNPNALISPQNFAPLKWENPLPVANRWADYLKNKKHCDVVILLSHLGTDIGHGDTSGICDKWLAENSRNIDLIVGGHTHMVVEDLHIKNLDGNEVILRQTGKSGINLGKVLLTIE